MKAKLIKDSDGYWLDISDDGITKRPLTDFGQLSIKNCEAIANGYDLDELAEKHYNVHIKKGHTEEDSLQRKVDFTLGFLSALEILGDKKFSEEDMINFAEYCKGDLMKTKDLFNEYQSLQQTEWDVEIEQELIQSSIEGEAIWKLKLDKDGCLILKRI